MVNKSIVAEWLKKADSDFQFASAVLEDTEYFNQICFLFQQAAEKYLKACIIAHAFKEKFPPFSELSEQADFLTGFYIETRYPDIPTSQVSPKTALHAKEAAKKIQHFAKKFLNY